MNVPRLDAQFGGFLLEAGRGFRFEHLDDEEIGFQLDQSFPVDREIISRSAKARNGGLAQGRSY